MNHRIVSTVVIIIVALFIAASALFTFAATVVSPAGRTGFPAPENPHPPAQETEACLDCHTVDDSTIPVTHRRFTEASCESCHPQSLRVLVPHSIAMGDTGCPLCHGEPGRDLGIPRSHLRYTTGECLLCHPVDTRYQDREPRPAGLSRALTNPMPHPTDGLFEVCERCHHVEPTSTLPENHRDFAPETCLACHGSGETIENGAP